MNFHYKFNCVIFVSICLILFQNVYTGASLLKFVYRFKLLLTILTTPIINQKKKCWIAKKITYSQSLSLFWTWALVDLKDCPEQFQNLDFLFVNFLYAPDLVWHNPGPPWESTKNHLELFWTILKIHQSFFQGIKIYNKVVWLKSQGGPAKIDSWPLKKSEEQNSSHNKSFGKFHKSNKVFIYDLIIIFSGFRWQT